MSELPSGWAKVPVTEVSTFVRGVTYGKADARDAPGPGLTGILRAMNLADSRFDLSDMVYVPDSCVSPEQRLQPGDVVIATSSGSASVVGKAVQVRDPMALSFGAFCGVLRPEPIIEPRYFGHYFRTDEYRSAASNAARGVNINNLKRSHFDSFEFAMPGRDTQKQIADKLDQLLARVHACRARLDRVPQILKRFREGVLDAAVSGRLTEAWRASRDANPNLEGYKSEAPPESARAIPSSWRWIAIGELAMKVTDGVHKKPSYVDAGVPFVTVKNLTAGPGIDLSETKFISEVDHAEFCKRTRPECGDLLVSKDGTLGVVRLVETTRPFSIFVSVALIKPKDKRFSPYLRLALESPVLQRQMVGVGTGLQHIHLQDLRRDVVPVPPFDEQVEIVRRATELFALADSLDRKLQRLAALVDLLRPAILKKAFRGKLVSQDPNDESAERLLERVRANRQPTSVGAPRAKRKGPVTPRKLVAL